VCVLDAIALHRYGWGHRPEIPHVLGEPVIRTPIVLVVEALTAIGRATAVAFAAQGACVVVSGRLRDAGVALAESLCASGTEAEFMLADVRHEPDVSELVRRTLNRFGRLDVAVNVAVADGVPGPLVEKTPADYCATFDSNVLGTFLSMKHELRAMLAQSSGCIMNVASPFGVLTAAGAAFDVASRHAVEGMTRAVALEAAPFGVRVNAISVEPVEAGLGMPLDGPEAAAGFADVIAFYCSAKASFVTGRIIGGDGGRVA
jgi:NAD(P)-dependent dehydrogenase (short-subunit alcohol dehydrogenase family)